MSAEHRAAAVATMLGARTVAVVGASPRPDSFGERMVTEARRGTARVHLVNPRHKRIGGLPCVPSLADLDEPVDLVLMGVPDSALIGQLESAVATGARSAVLFGSAHGMRDKVAAIATDAGMALCGAGCMGFVNNTLGVRALGYLEPDPLPDGGVSLITHSGSAFSTLLRAHRGFGYRLAVSSGQEIVTDTADYVRYALGDPGTTLIALLLETPRALPRLRGALLAAADQNVPVVLLPVGGSPTGSAMVAAHSGALAGGDVAWQAFCDAVGAIRVRDLAELADTIEVFAPGRRARAGTHGIATVHDSGAERALTADIAHDLGIEFAQVGEGTRDALSELLDDGLHAVNPLDVWGTGANTRTLLGACLRLMADDPAVAVTALAADLVTEFDGDTAYTDAMLDVAAESDQPLAVLTSVPSAVDRDAASLLRGNGIPVLEGTRSGLAALGHLARWSLTVQRVDAGVDADRRTRVLDTIAEAAPGSEFEVLRAYGIPVADFGVARSAQEALATAAGIGYPVALKTLAAEHKTDVGGVMLGITDPAALSVAYDEMAVRLGPTVTVSAMAASGVEVSVAVVRDAAFGPLLVVAAGGALVELIADRAVAVPPVSRSGAGQLVDSLRIRPLLDGWRGAPAADVEALVDVVLAFSSLAVELGEDIEAVEANPVIVSASGAVAVDALIQPRGQKIE
jgi:acyl-CoA synthetase (NDP forming)